MSSATATDLHKSPGRLVIIGEGKGASIEASDGAKVAILNNTLVELNLCLRRGSKIIACKNDLGPGEWFFYEMSDGLKKKHTLRLEGRVADGREFYQVDSKFWTTSALAAGAVLVGSTVLTGGASLLIGGLCTVPVWGPLLMGTTIGVNVASKAALITSIGVPYIQRSLRSPSELAKDGIPVDGAKWLRIIGGPGSAGGPLDLAGRLDSSRVEDFVVEEGEWQVLDEVLASLKDSEAMKGQLPVSYLPVVE